jgi:Ca-activated chloride channel homolog
MENAFRFEDERMLIGLAIIPLLLLLYLITVRYQRKQMHKWGDERLLSRLMPDFSATRGLVKFILWSLALGIMVLALARPQFGTKLSEVKRKGIEMIIALDVSNSMMAEDIQPNRLENAKMAISRLVDQLENDKIGLIVFAGDAYIQMPVTTDYQAAKLFLNTINTQIVPRQGTAIESAIRLAMRSFTPNSEKSRAIVIITDGENHEEGATEAAKEAADGGIIIHTIGIGSAQGVPIPVTSAGGQKDYRTDHEGKVIISKLNESLLREVAAAGGGSYVRATASRTGLNTILDEMNKMEKQEIQMKVYAEYDEQFLYYAGLALLLLLIDFALGSRKNKWIQNIQLFGKKEVNL